ncbi:MAG: hypothetical protein J1E40_02535 [Oscillospiraceae bacterium]|nr:hypothetical protein [Oscillospiraceae bacterium]
MSMRIGGGGRNYQLTSKIYSAARLGIKGVNRFALRKSLDAKVYSGKLPNALNSFKGAIKNGQTGSIADKFQTGTSSANTNDYNLRASKNLKDLTDTCEKFNSSLEKKLRAAGIPKDISFEFDYDINSDKAVITSISDEKYRDSLQAVLDGMDKTGTLDYIGKSSGIMNGNIAPSYYPEFANALKKCFGQDISKLYIDEKGNIGGANSLLQKALSAEKFNRSFDAQKSYGFPSKQLAAMIKRLLSDEGISNNVSHMGYDGKGIYTNDGNIKLGTKADPTLTKNSRYTLKAAFASRTASAGDYDYWLSNEDLFR